MHRPKVMHDAPRQHPRRFKGDQHRRDREKEDIMTQASRINLTPSSGNFDFLKQHDPLFFQLAQSAELAFSSDPNTTLVKLRQLGEAIAQDLAVRCHIEFDDKTSNGKRKMACLDDDFRTSLLNSMP